MVGRVALSVACAVGVIGIIAVSPGIRRGAAAAVSTPSNPRADAARELESAPRALAGAELGVGRWVSSVSAKDLDGKVHSFQDLAGPRGLVIAFVSSSCPVAKKLAPALGRLESEFAPKGIRFAYLAPLSGDASSDLTSMAKTAGLKGPLLRSPDGAMLARLGAASTTEVFVLDSARTLVYRGAVSDQYGPTWSLDAPRIEYLRPALEALLAGRAPEPAATTAPGCAVNKPEILPKETTPTYHPTVSRIVQNHCVECHRKGGPAPFSLESMEDVLSHSAMIERVVQAGRMPPWFAAPEPEGRPSRWANDRTLPARDRSDLLAWLKGFRGRGNPADAPLPRSYDPTWQIGKPDAVFQLPEPVAVKAEGTMPYVRSDVETHFTEDRWVQAIEVAPTDRSVVHHVLVLLRSGEAGRGGSDVGDELSGFFGIYVPGNSTLVYPPGFAKKIPAGSRLRFQMHYTPNGKATEDQTRVGFKFATKPPEHEVRVGSLASLRISIPPGASNHPETARLPVPVEAKVMAFLPHMHLRGKSAKYEAVAPDGTRQTLLDVPKYDFNWQLYYRLAEPVTLKPGSRLEFTGHFDNSRDNPANPDPGKTVRWGPQTTDEMLLGYVEYYLTDPAAGSLPARGGGGDGVEALFKRADKNADGKVTPDELPRPILFKRLDVNGDGTISLEEAKARLPMVGR